MGKKSKKEKGRGAEKTAKKMAKKDLKREGLEDLEAMIAQFQELDKQKTTYHEEKCSHPPARSSLSMVAHPEKEELIFFGGEYFNGRKTCLYNDIFIYNIKKNEWTQQFIPNTPPPRCAHQAVVVAQDGGQMWIFGGEFASPNNLQFYHYKDLWMLNLRNHTWQEVHASGGPSPRSGHRMVVYKKQIVLFGGFHESHKNFIYFNDCYTFSLSDYVWTKILANGNAPSPRSACQLAVTPTGVLVLGGYSKVKLKKDLEKGSAHSDVFLLSDESTSKWKWSQVKDSGNKPWPRSSFSLAQMSPNRAVMFGGVCDDDKEEDIDSYFFNSLSCIDLVAYRWFALDLRQKTLNQKAKSTQESGDNGDNQTALLQETEPTQVFLMPCVRMNSLVVVKKNVLYLYGGVFEESEKQVTLNDLWCIDIRKMDSWKQLVEADDTSTDWMEEDNNDEDSSEDEEESGECSTSNDRKTQDSIKNSNQPPPPVDDSDTTESYWLRTKDYWLEIACSETNEETRANQTECQAKRKAETYFNLQ